MSKRVRSSLLPLLFLGAVIASSVGPKGAANVEAVFAGPAYNKVMSVANVGGAEYRDQVTARLEYLETALRGRDVSGWSAELRAERSRNIERLRAYRLEGKFPINYDYPGEQHPCFLDRDGNLCAVANLIAKSAGMDLVRQINSRYQYATVSEMKMPEIDAWIAQSGLTREEVITIQEPGSFSEPVFSGGYSAPVVADTTRQISGADTAVSAVPPTMENRSDLSLER